MPKMKLNFHDRINKVWLMMKFKEDNDLTNRTSAMYAEIRIKLS